MSSLTESIVEAATLTWFEELGYLKRWSAPSGFLDAQENGAKRRYRLKEGA